MSTDAVVVLGRVVVNRRKAPLSDLLFAAMIKAGLNPQKIHLRSHMYVEDFYTPSEEIDRFGMTGELMAADLEARIEKLLKEQLHGVELTSIRAILLPERAKHETLRCVSETPWGWLIDWLDGHDVAIYQGCSTPDGTVQWLDPISSKHFGKIPPK